MNSCSRSSKKTKALARTLVSFFSLTLFALHLDAPLASGQDETLTDFADIEELNRRSSRLVVSDTERARWFEPDSNYGRLFLKDRGPESILTWLGMTSSEFKVENFQPRSERSLCGIKAQYSSKRKNEPHFQLIVLLPHPRSFSSRSLNLIKDFTDLENHFTKSDAIEEVRISGLSAKLALAPEEEICKILIPISRQGLLYAETMKCKDGKKLIEFTEALDIVRLNAKLEK